MEPELRQYLAMVVYRCVVAGEPSGSLDVQTQYHLAASEDDVRRQVESEEPQTYENHLGETVDWEFRAVMAVEELANLESGNELVGFIAELDELRDLA